MLINTRRDAAHGFVGLFQSVRAVAFLVALVAVFVPRLPAHAIETSAREALLLDFDTGTVLLDKDSDVSMPPSSMSKLMTVFMVFEQLKAGRLSLDDTFTVSENAWQKGGAASGGSTMFLEPHSTVRLEDLLRGIIVQSGNDACIVLAEHLAGTEDAFADAMTRRAHEIGLTHSNFRNATGLPHPDHVMTARDLSTLARRIITDFPEYYPYYSEKEFTYNGITQHNRNPLLYKNIGADGLKTGHTSVAGYGLTASAMQNGRRLILVLNGLESTRARTEEADRLMSWGFRTFENVEMFRPGATVTEASVWLGQTETVPLVLPEGLTVTLPRNARRTMTVTVRYDGPIPAPISRGDQIATLAIEAPDMQALTFPLEAGTNVERMGVVNRMFAALRHIIVGLALPDPAAEAAGDVPVPADSE
ncbi:D-alanyl-D-alanine carboxypeptidase [Roseospira marina]|uniref:serine-type D-Ala-D-Ala carboxypeptidase n=1 Tax=Roseospira marina TaxID=140057 RepID=A0A5M6II25_9PROT|nr:D-alanyl-D-alanine carboxypeptidase family protein [Roseospira marina]KAA5607248.1 D-alanyl-D-alanine carboxypeptidase [Roseospira marina]MBB4312600.1 D-alanyl-D-alanine carboxypeptidase (penicillin-binding protein 5/6) [Roseospira marina]MBB5085384.1 D-alanyl-D-alanine carboxypeptidase (penicillin-binding protein 5/6) [Roseospira marina]